MAYTASPVEESAQTQNPKRFSILIPYVDPNVVDADGNTVQLFRKEITSIEMADQIIANHTAQIVNSQEIIADQQERKNAMLAASE